MPTPAHRIVAEGVGTALLFDRVPAQEARW